MVRGVNECAIDLDEPFVAGLVANGADLSGEVVLEIFSVAFGAFDDVTLATEFEEWKQAGLGHFGLAQFLLLDEFGVVAMVAAFDGVAVEDEYGLVVGDDALDLQDGSGPAFPEPFLVVVFAEGDGVAGAGGMEGRG